MTIIEFDLHCHRLAELNEKVRKGGGENSIARHTKRNRKLLVRDRLRLLLDDEDFLELSPIAGMGLPYGDIPAAGCLTGETHGNYNYVGYPDTLFYIGQYFCLCIRYRQNLWSMVCIYCQRCNSQRWHSISNHSEETAKSPRSGDSKPPAMRLPGGLWRSFPSTAG